MHNRTIRGGRGLSNTKSENIKQKHVSMRSRILALKSLKFFNISKL